MTESDFDGFSDDALEFAFNESNKLLDSTLTSFREIINKSYIALGVYSTILAYYFEKFNGQLPYIIILVGTATSIYLLWRNLMPGKISFSGTLPQDIIHPFYKGKNNLMRELYISKLLAHKNGIQRNVTEVNIRNKRFKSSALVLLSAFALAFLCSFSWIGKCFPIWI